MQNHTRKKIFAGHHNTLNTIRHCLSQATADTECEQMTDFHTTTQNLTQSCGTEKAEQQGLNFYSH